MSAKRLACAQTLTPGASQSPADIQSAVQVLYDKSVAHTADKHRQAMEKYCAPLTPPRLAPF